MPKPIKPRTGPASKVRPGDSEDEAGTYAEDRYGATDTGESDSGVTLPRATEKKRRAPARERKSSGEDNPTA